METFNQILILTSALKASPAHNIKEMVIEMVILRLLQFRLYLHKIYNISNTFCAHRMTFFMTAAYKIDYKELK